MLVHGVFFQLNNFVVLFFLRISWNLILEFRIFDQFHDYQLFNQYDIKDKNFSLKYQFNIYISSFEKDWISKLFSSYITIFKKNTIILFKDQFIKLLKYFYNRKTQLNNKGSKLGEIIQFQNLNHGIRINHRINIISNIIIYLYLVTIKKNKNLVQMEKQQNNKEGSPFVKKINKQREQQIQLWRLKSMNAIYFQINCQTSRSLNITVKQKLLDIYLIIQIQLIQKYLYSLYN
ncbi:hypothetical protein pb186bvf_017823 [Paramecium bursaria]